MYEITTAADVCTILGFILALALAIEDRVRKYRLRKRIKEKDAEGINEARNGKE